MFSRERSFSIPTAKVFPLECFAVYIIILSLRNQTNHSKIRSLVLPTILFYPYLNAISKFKTRNFDVIKLCVES